MIYALWFVLCDLCFAARGGGLFAVLLPGRAEIQAERRCCCLGGARWARIGIYGKGVDTETP